MKILYSFCLIISILISSGCGKKASLERYPNSSYPQQYPKQNER